MAKLGADLYGLFIDEGPHRCVNFIKVAGDLNGSCKLALPLPIPLQLELQGSDLEIYAREL
ncbi:TPA: hypothetical protein MX316_006764 [Pseudomonas aeruginosa]|nr:hypothetical protein PAER4782_34710 [Pseudomonas aeruginosa]CAI9912242.1 hypothetical protein PAER4782_34710 [Pseudomonas aeruginosa]HCA7380191.1 hypothetical protein [Pseudomonas aeruginosa]